MVFSFGTFGGSWTKALKLLSFAEVDATGRSFYVCFVSACCSFFRWFAERGLWLGLCACELGGAVRPALHLLGLNSFGSDWISLDLCCISAMNFHFYQDKQNWSSRGYANFRLEWHQKSKEKCGVCEVVGLFWSRMTAQRRFKLEMNWNQEELEQWAIAARQKEEDSFSDKWKCGVETL